VRKTNDMSVISQSVTSSIFRQSSMTSSNNNNLLKETIKDYEGLRALCLK